MELTPEEQGLITEFRKLSPAGRDELLSCATSLGRKAGAEQETIPNQCRLKDVEQRPETEKAPFFTE
jgi:hypothetical protein